MINYSKEKNIEFNLFNTIKKSTIEYWLEQQRQELVNPREPSYPVIMGSGSLDGHFWIEDDEGNKIDNEYDYYKQICELRNLDVNKKRYVKWTGETGRKIKLILLCNWYENMFEVMGAVDEDYIEQVLKLKSENPRPRECMTNTFFYYFYHTLVLGRKDLNICCGSMGWEYKDKEGVYYEYG